MSIIVTKRDGSKQPWDLQKIRKQLDYAYRGTGLNPLELESKISLSLKPNIKTSEIQELMIQTAIAMISLEQPEMSLVAGRLAMHQLHRMIYKSTKIEWNEFEKYIDYALKNKFYRDDFIKAYTKDDIAKLEQLFDLEYDYSQVIAQVMSLKSKYLIKSKKGIVEYPQFSDMTSSMILASVEKEPMKWAGWYFNKLSEQKISLATPFKSNLRRPDGNTGSCFILPTGDSLLQITKTWSDMATISKEGGGIGVYLGWLRPGESWSTNIPKANKINRWTKIINDIAIAVNQRGIRKGAITPAIDWWHMDIFDFVEMKTETESDLREKCFDLFPQVVVDQFFMERKEADGFVYLFDQYELKQLTGIDVPSLVDDELYQAHLKVEELIESKKLKHFKQIKAKDLWKKMMKVWFETGDFYITKKEGLNLSNYLKCEGYIANSANLCVESFSITQTPTSWKQEVVDAKIVHSESNGMYHSCSLISLCLNNLLTDDELEDACKAAVRALDVSIDMGTMPVVEAENSAQALRNIGIGTLGAADWMAYHKLSYEKEEDLDKLEALYERIAWYCYNASIDLAIEKGSYPLFEKANYDKMFGKPVEELNNLSKNGYDWVALAKRIKENGIRNFLINAVAPNTSSGILQGAVASYLPPHSKLNYQTLADMSVPILPKYIKTRFWYYKSKFQYPAHKLIDMTRRVQRWTDTGVSMEVAINPELSTIKQISDSITDGFLKDEIKAVYYSVSIDGLKEGCTDCAN